MIRAHEFLILAVLDDDADLWRRRLAVAELARLGHAAWCPWLWDRVAAEEASGDRRARRYMLATGYPRRRPWIHGAARRIRAIIHDARRTSGGIDALRDRDGEILRPHQLLWEWSDGWSDGALAWLWARGVAHRATWDDGPTLAAVLMQPSAMPEWDADRIGRRRKR